jgi:hypothetical protein
MDLVYTLIVAELGGSRLFSKILYRFSRLNGVPLPWESQISQKVTVLFYFMLFMQ